MFGGDPRQILPIVCHGNRANIVKAYIVIFAVAFDYTS